MATDVNIRNDATEPEGYRLGLDAALKEAIQAFVDERFVPEDELESTMFGNATLESAVFEDAAVSDASVEDAAVSESYRSYSAPTFARNMLTVSESEAVGAAPYAPAPARKAAPPRQDESDRQPAPAKKRRGGVIGSVGKAIGELTRRGKHAKESSELYEDELEDILAEVHACESAAEFVAGYAEEPIRRDEAEQCETAERCEQEQTFFKEAPNASRKMRSYDATPFYGAGAYDDGLKQWLDEVDAPFSTTLLRLIDERGYDDVDVYKRAGMSRQLFSRIRSDAAYRPAKKTVLALAVALRLNAAEARDLLERAGFALSHSDKRDLVVEYFLENGKHDLMAVNQALYEFDQPLL